MHGKRYGYTATHLTLTEKAEKAYDNSDPIGIFEVEEGDFFFYHIYFGNEKRYGLTEEEVNEYLEDLYDGTGAEVIG